MKMRGKETQETQERNEETRNRALALKDNLGMLVEETSNTVLGYLFEFHGRGIFSPSGKVEITAQQADVHNRLLSRGEILGLDENCQVGQHGTFYYRSGSVITWVGELVSDSVTVNGQVITFQRNGKVFRGQIGR